MADDKKRDLDSDSKPDRQQPPPMSSSGLSNNPILPVLAYCGSSILMTVTNKYVLSGSGFNLNFFLLCVQVCAVCTPSTLRAIADAASSRSCVSLPSSPSRPPKLSPIATSRPRRLRNVSCVVQLSLAY